MPSPSSSSGAEPGTPRHRAVAGIGLLLGLLAATPAPAATVLQRHVVHQVRPDGSVLETTRLRVRLDTEADLASWSPYPILLDENRDLVSLEASVVQPGGREVKVKRRDQDRMDWTLAGELHSSRKAHLVPFPAAPVGSVIHLDYQVQEHPYFPAGRIFLREGDEAVADLRVEVQGAGNGWRWHLAGDHEGMEASEIPGGVLLQGHDLPALAGQQAHTEPPELLYAWGERSSWQQIGEWYQELLQPLTRGSEAIRDQARQLTGGLSDPRARLEALLGFLRRNVRYVAVEVGIGGYQPSPPATVLERRWGDCKDKALLLIDLLQATGIEAYPVIIRSSLDDDIEADFPSPLGFNHLIVAVPADAVAVQDDDPVADGLLFLDPTQESGNAGWLHPEVQRKQALVVRGAQSGLVLTPGAAQEENRELLVELAVSENGSASGHAELMATGTRATSYRQLVATPQAEQGFRYLFATLLPGAELSEMSWGFDDATVPTLRLSTRVRFKQLIQGDADRRSFTLPGLTGLPEPQEITGATTLLPGRHRARWRLTLPPDWCLPEAAEVAEANDIGSFRQHIEADGQTVQVERRSEVLQARLDGEALEPLRALALTEHRTLRRRIRLRCEP